MTMFTTHNSFNNMDLAFMVESIQMTLNFRRIILIYLAYHRLYDRDNYIKKVNV